jgi:hypothetical protein
MKSAAVLAFLLVGFAGPRNGASAPHSKSTCQKNTDR